MPGSYGPASLPFIDRRADIGRDSETTMGMVPMGKGFARTRNSRLFVGAVAALLAYAALSAGQASAAVWDDVAWMYQPSEVVDIHLTMDDSQKALLNSDDPLREYVGGVGFWMTGSEGRSFGSSGTPWRIEAKLKGHSTFRFLDQKAAFNLKFPKESRPNGLKKMTLNNMVKDPTYLRETLSYDVIRAAGMPAPRTGYARLWINDEYYGLYLNLEKWTDQSLAHWFAATGHLFEAVRTQDIVRSGDALKTDFEVDEGDEADWSDLEAFSAAVRTRNWTTIQSHLASPGQTIRMLAAEWYLGHWDGYSWSRRNYYLHSDPNGLFTLLPTGTDQALRPPFGDNNYDLSYPLSAAADTWNQPGGASAIVDACFADSACSEQFIDELEAVRQAADGLDLETRVPELTAALTPLIESDPRKEFTMRFIQRWQGDVIPWFNGQDSRVDQLVQTQPPPQYSLVTVKTGAGSGNVGANPAGPLYDPGTVVTLTATADPGSSFVGWSGCDSVGANGDCVITMAAPRTVTAEFAASRPVITATDPASPADNNLPRVIGTLPSGVTVSKVKVYANGDCSGTPAANRNADLFTGAGIAVAVADNTTTTLTAKGVLAGGGTTPCSDPFTYVEASGGP
ncbi:MAG: CotH kinase family protein [Solirubrobacterales bacterium]|nr:CotH kinase family protein [Solirubrobacterales bacterium]